MARLVACVDVEASPDQVFAALVDWPGQGDWIPATTVWVASGDGASVGSTIVARSAVGPIGFDDELVITRWDPPHLIDVNHVGRLVRGPARFRVVPVSERVTRVLVAENLSMPGGIVGEAGWHAIKPLARAGLSRALRSFRDLVEAGPQRT